MRDVITFLVGAVLGGALTISIMVIAVRGYLDGMNDSQR